MINISTVIREIVEEDYEILPVFRVNMLNLSSYARLIHKEVEMRSFKKVKLASLIVALSRLAKQYTSDEDTLPLRLENLSVHVNLVDLSFEKTRDNLTRTKKLMESLPKDETFFTITQGITEITIIADASLIKQTKTVFTGVVPLSEITDLVGITVKSDFVYTGISGVFYKLLGSLQIKKINIVEIVSTATEITFIVNKADVQGTVNQLSKFLA